MFDLKIKLNLEDETFHGLACHYFAKKQKVCVQCLNHLIRKLSLAVRRKQLLHQKSIIEIAYFSSGQSWTETTFTSFFL